MFHVWLQEAATPDRTVQMNRHIDRRAHKTTQSWILSLSVGLQSSNETDAGGPAIILTNLSTQLQHYHEKDSGLTNPLLIRRTYWNWSGIYSTRIVWYSICRLKKPSFSQASRVSPWFAPHYSSMTWSRRYIRMQIFSMRKKSPLLIDEKSDSLKERMLEIVLETQVVTS